MARSQWILVFCSSLTCFKTRVLLYIALPKSTDTQSQNRVTEQSIHSLLINTSLFWSWWQPAKDTGRRFYLFQEWKKNRIKCHYLWRPLKKSWATLGLGLSSAQWCALNHCCPRHIDGQDQPSLLLCYALSPNSCLPGLVYDGKLRCGSHQESQATCSNMM